MSFTSLRRSAPAATSLAAFVVAAACSSSTSSGGSTDSPDAAAAAACAYLQTAAGNMANAPDCPVAPGGTCLPSSGCDPASIPEGLACSTQYCKARIDPCVPLAQNGRIDFWACTCLDGRWACGLCGAGASTCAEAGAADATTGMGNDAGTPPDAYVAATVSAGSSAPSCPVGASANPWLAIGTATAGKPTTMIPGDSAGGGSVAIACTVRAAGTGYDVQLSAGIVGGAASSVTITSPAGQGAVSTTGGSGITASFSSAIDGGGTYAASDCTIAFTYQNAPLSVSPAVAAGRIWGHLSCPHATMGGPVCDAEADFLFENCGQ